MMIGETFRTAWRSLVSNRMRTVLTGLGMVIGVAAVVAVLAVGEGAQSQVEGRIRSLGSNLLTVRPERGSSGGVRSGSVQTLTLDDAESLRQIPGVAAVSPEVSGNVLVRPRNPAVKQEPPLPLSVELAQGVSARDALAESIRAKVRSVLLVQTRIELVPWGRLERSEYKSTLVER